LYIKYFGITTFVESRVAAGGSWWSCPATLHGTLSEKNLIFFPQLFLNYWKSKSKFNK